MGAAACSRARPLGWPPFRLWSKSPVPSAAVRGCHRPWVLGRVLAFRGRLPALSLAAWACLLSLLQPVLLSLALPSGPGSRRQNEVLLR